MTTGNVVLARSNEEIQIHSRVRPQPRSPVASSTEHHIGIHHPAYRSSCLIDLSAFNAAGGGIHHGTALLICGILAGNAWNGWLTEERLGPRLRVSLESVLTGELYYFHLPNPSQEQEQEQEQQHEPNQQQPYKYPIVPSFQHWSSRTVHRPLAGRSERTRTTPLGRSSSPCLR